MLHSFHSPLLFPVKDTQTDRMMVMMMMIALTLQLNYITTLVPLHKE